MEYLVIDGYNVICAWNEMFDLTKESLEDCRDRFLAMVSSYQGLKKLKVMVVFDAHHAKYNKDVLEKYDHLTVIYTRENITADNYIERFVYNRKPDDMVKVVTSDYLEQTMILRIGATRMTPRELLNEMDQLGKTMKRSTNDKGVRTNTIMDNLSADVLEKFEKMRRDKF